MRTTALALLTSLLPAAVQAATPGDVSWYDPIRKATCTGHTDGTITCQAGEVEAALKPNTLVSSSRHAIPQAGKTTDHSTTTTSNNNNKKSTPVLNTRQDDTQDSIGGNTCAGEGAVKALGCFLNCFGQGFCTAKCDAGTNACQCSCKDGGDKGGVPCSKSSC